MAVKVACHMITEMEQRFSAGVASMVLLFLKAIILALTVLRRLRAVKNALLQKKPLKYPAPSVHRDTGSKGKNAQAAPKIVLSVTKMILAFNARNNISFKINNANHAKV